MTINDFEIFILLGTALAFLLISFIIIVIILYRRSQLKFQIEKQALQQALLQTEVEIREQTLQNISRDLHDNFGQIASLIKINLNLLSKDLNPADTNHIQESKDLLKKLIGDIRSLSSALATDNLKNQGLVKMIESDLTRVGRTGAVKVVFNNQFQDPTIEGEKMIFIYRMFQELLNNALKHAKAQIIKVHLKGEGAYLSLNIKDDGVGIPIEKLNNQKHGLNGNGLLNLKERCAIIGAQYQLNSAPGEGTEIEISLQQTKKN